LYHSLPLPPPLPPFSPNEKVGNWFYFSLLLSQWPSSEVNQIEKYFFFKYFLGGFFLFFPYNIQHCFIFRPSDSTVPPDAGIEPRTVATGALAVRKILIKNKTKKERGNIKNKENRK
jgi:hypothetical protein